MAGRYRPERVKRLLVRRQYSVGDLDEWSDESRVSSRSRSRATRALDFIASPSPSLTHVTLSLPAV